MLHDNLLLRGACALLWAPRIRVFGITLLLCGASGSVTHAQRGAQQPPADPPSPPAPASDPLAGWQEIRIVKPDLDVSQMTRQKYNVKKFLQSKGQIGGLASKQFDEYFELIMLPQLTQPQHLDRAPELRDELVENFGIAARANNQPAFDHLNDLVLDYMQMIVRGPVRAVAANGRGLDVLWNGDPQQPEYWKLTGGTDGKDRGVINPSVVVRREPPQKKFHPACRYNAMMVIGRLNEKMTWQQANRAFEETPLRKALRPMVEAAGDETLPEPVRLAAMLGIQRHLEKSQLPPGALDLICGVMSRVCKEKTAATGHLADGHLWLRRQAIDVMGACGVEGQGQAYTRVLTDRMTDPAEPLTIRQAAAAAVAKVKHRSKMKPGEAAELSGKLATLAVDVARYELDPAPQKQPQFSKRRAADGFDCVVLALGGKSSRLPAAAEGEPVQTIGILKSAPANEQPYVQGLINRVAALRTACATSQSEGALRNVLSEGASDINAFAAGGPEKALSAPEKGAGPLSDDAAKPKPAAETAPMPTADNPF